MGDSEENTSPSGIPAWQRESQQTEPEPQVQPEPPAQNTEDHTPAEDKLQVARRFLQDDQIKDASRERKEEFLKTKGLTSSEIEELLGSSSALTLAPAPEENMTGSELHPDADDRQPAQEQAEAAPNDPTTPPSSEPRNEVVSLPRQSDNPPVITYPEFLTKPTRPPPLITANGIFNTFYAFAGLSTLLYGTSKFMVAPMVENLTEARTDLHSTTSEKLNALIEKLEGTVSEIPSKKATQEPYKDDMSTSEIDDPSELFHRDIGTQTSFPSTPKLGATWSSSAGGTEDKNSTVCEKQVRKLTDMGLHARSLREACVTEAEDLAHVKASMDVLKDDLVQLAYPAPKDYSAGLYGYGSRSNEPDDEIKKARDNIRRVKGVLLSTRNFPASVR